MSGREGAHKGTVVVFCAHPDDEAIFTGGTIAALSAAGNRIVVVVATSGELGVGGSALAVVRRSELATSCEILGVDRLVVLDHVDSGVAADSRARPWGAFAEVDVEVVADHLASIIEGERAVAL